MFPKLNICVLACLAIGLISCPFPSRQASTERQIDRLASLLEDGRFTNFDMPSLSTDAIDHCYEATLGSSRHQLNIFSGSLTFRQIAVEYYSAFPHKAITLENLSSLFKSLNEIVKFCRQSPNSTVKLGLTELSDLSDEEMANRFGVLTSSAQFDRPANNSGKCKLTTTNLPRKFDWREKGMVSQVKDQKDCGSCWVFSSISAIESAVKIKYPKDPMRLFSEQQVLNCARPYGCLGGHLNDVFEYTIRRGLKTAESVPYKGEQMECIENSRGNAFFVADYCVRSDHFSDRTIQSALVQFGPLVVYIEVNRNLLSYRSGVFDDPSCWSGGYYLHAVLLVGYDEHSWTFKNSWGERWGEGGYFRMVRGKNVCQMNSWRIGWPLIR